MSHETVVITGAGMISPLGLDRASSVAAFRAGDAAVGPIEGFDASTFPWRAGGEVRGFVPRKQLPDRKAVKLMSPPARLAVAAALDARRDARDEAPADAEDGGLFIAAGYETIDLASVLRMMARCRPPGASPDSADHDTIDVVELWREARYRMNPLDALKILPNMALAHVSIALGLRGANSAIGPHGAAGLQALADAARAVRAGEVPFAIAGGADAPVNVFMVSYFGVAGLLSERGRCAPFDADADGTVVGDGAAMLWLETDARARRRGARVRARLLGAGQAHHAGPYGPPTTPEPWLHAGAAALAEADVAARDVVRWSADGWGVPGVDRAERDAAASLFDGDPPPRRTLKDRIGHTFAAAGALDVALSCCDPARDGAGGPELLWAAGADGTVAALVLDVVGRGGAPR